MASDPIRMIIANIAGSAVAAVIGYIEQPIPIITWLLCICAGIAVTALIIGFTRTDKVLEDTKSVENHL